ncbi:hypothetical protein [Streptomyces sp. NPDC089919]|uniref:hypothetical protein n=1 Tax=Streptomyces sp. NPDC089919 TaxID=3155188 RepID=UPI003434F196
MSQEFVPEHTGQAEYEQVVPAQSGPPKGLLQQMEELMAALNADLSQLDADLQTSAERPRTDAPLSAEPLPPIRTHESERPSYRPETERPSYRSY